MFHSSGKHDIPAVRLLEYWRVKNPTNSTYKALYDALKRSGKNDLAENVYNASPEELSRDVLSRPKPLLRHQYTPSPTLEIRKKPSTTVLVAPNTTDIKSTRSPTMESDSHFIVSPVPSDVDLSSSSPIMPSDTDLLSNSPNNTQSDVDLSLSSSPNAQSGDDRLSYSQNNSTWNETPSSPDVSTTLELTSVAYDEKAESSFDRSNSPNRLEQASDSTEEKGELDEMEKNKSGEFDDNHNSKLSEYEESPLSSLEYGTGQERWSSTATYATNTPEEEKLPDDDSRPRSPISPVSIRSDRYTFNNYTKDSDDGTSDSRPTSFRRESFDNSVVTPCDVSATVTPNTCSPVPPNEEQEESSSPIPPTIESDEVVEIEYVIPKIPSEIDFSILGEEGSQEDEMEKMETNGEEERVTSPYELSVLQKQREMDEAWELEHSRDNKPRDHESSQLVAEEDIAEVKQEAVLESGIEFKSMEDAPENYVDNYIGDDVNEDGFQPVIVGASLVGVVDNEPESDKGEPCFDQAVDNLQEANDVQSEPEKYDILEHADPIQTNNAGEHISRSDGVSENYTENIHVTMEQYAESYPDSQELNTENYPESEPDFADQNRSVEEEHEDVKRDTPVEVDFACLGEPDEVEFPQAPLPSDERVSSPYELSLQRKQREMEEEEWEKEKATLVANGDRYSSRTPVQEEDVDEEIVMEDETSLKYLENDKPEVAGCLQIDPFEDFPDQEDSCNEKCTVDDGNLPAHHNQFPVAYDNDDADNFDLTNQNEKIIVSQTVTEEEATPYYELSPSEKINIGEKLVEAPVYAPETQSGPSLTLADDEAYNPDDAVGEDEIQIFPVTEGETQSAPFKPFNSFSPDHHDKETGHQVVPSPTVSEENMLEKYGSASDTSAVDDESLMLRKPNSSLQSPSNEYTANTFPTSITNAEYDTTAEVRQYQESQFVQNGESGFTKVVSNTTVSEKVLSMTKTEAREVTPEELQRLLAQQQQNGDGTTITTTTFVHRQIVNPDGSIETVVTGDDDASPRTSITYEGSQVVHAIDSQPTATTTAKDAEVLEIELESDEDNLTEQELVERLFGGQQDVLEFFHDGDVLDGDEAECGGKSGVGKVDEYGTQV